MHFFLSDAWWLVLGVVVVGTWGEYFVQISKQNREATVVAIVATQVVVFLPILLMAEIFHHLGCMKPYKSINNGMNYQPQLVSPISAINRMTDLLHLQTS